MYDINLRTIERGKLSNTLSHLKQTMQFPWTNMSKTFSPYQLPRY